VIDFHCHLDLYENPPEVIQGCVSRRMYVLAVTTTPSAWSGTRALVNGAQRVRVALGLHPQLASERRNELDLFDRLLPEARYVGEIGLDGSKELQDQWRDQVAVFERILLSCRAAGGRIMSIHCRRAVGQVLERIEACGPAGVPVLHWYSGSQRDLERAVNLGCWFSVGPATVLSENGRRLIERMPAGRVLTETDGPFASFRGRRALPWDIDAAIPKLAEIWQVSREMAEARLTENLQRLVGGDTHQTSSV
jgi:TatD DNase family protein